VDKKNKKIIKIIWQFLAIFLFIFLILYFISNYQGLSARIKYQFFSKEINIESLEKGIIKEENSVEATYNDTLVIPKIAVKAPIVWTKNESEVVEDLQLGVSHYPLTSKPGEKGNILISGHSSNYFWRKGDYNSIFVNFSELKNNDEIFVFYKNKKYNYKVFENKVLSLEESNKEIFRTEEKSILNLVTCWPVGTSWKRLIVKAI
jgi:LPXTG-site transpeptidase (sortase) family protein